MVDLCHSLERYALNYPETVLGTSCKKTAVKARKKSFLFILADETQCELMFKLEASLDQARALAASNPANCVVGDTGWVTIKTQDKGLVPEETLKAWVEESFRLLAPKTLVKQMELDRAP
jgi:predicted DNA-binding protein (MmcQ/YjbR family)